LETIGENSIFQVYGLTEVSPLVTCLQQEDIVLEGEASEHMASIGKELFFCHVRVVDIDDNDVKPGELGEIIAKGPNVSKGYWKRPKETEEAFQNGWIYTGDIGTVDKNGYIYHKDRRKDLIITGGENVSSYEVEDVIYKLPSVSMCAVIGVPHEKWGETVKAVVVLGEGQSVSEKEIIEHCITFLAKYKAPTSVSFADDLPKDETGKISKLKLRNEFGA
jgi:acyl-CoA synthetase (AMP-forming)/AMP-acid ligase II